MTPDFVHIHNHSQYSRFGLQEFSDLSVNMFAGGSIYGEMSNMWQAMQADNNSWASKKAQYYKAEVHRDVPWC